MRELIGKDDGQLRRIEQAIAAAALWPVAERNRKRYLLNALQTERSELLRARAGHR